MLPFLHFFSATLAQVSQLPPAPLDVPEVKTVIQSTEVRPLPGKLDNVPVFNSNSPEIVKTEGILLSTFPSVGKVSPEAHLNLPLQGRFDLFSHHISQAKTESETRTLFQGIILHNPGKEVVRVEILQAASYLTRPDALFIDLPDYLEDRVGNVYSGPGSRVMSDILRRRRQGLWVGSEITIPPGQNQILMNLPIPAGKLTPTSNARSTFMQLESSAPVYVANLAMFAPMNPDGSERTPTLMEWEELLERGGLAGSRDVLPTPIGAKTRGQIIYGRVAGVAQGSQWQSYLTDSRYVSYLTIPKPGKAIAYGLSTLYNGRLGTGQIQSARMLVRYPDTAFQAHGNYGIKYTLKLPLYNPTNKVQKVSLFLQTPLKYDEPRNELHFLSPPEKRIFFRGTLKFIYRDDLGMGQLRYIHLIQRRGQQGEALVTLNLKSGERRKVEVEFLYPPDATPPQVLTIKNEEF